MTVPLHYTGWDGDWVVGNEKIQISSEIFKRMIQDSMLY